MPSTTSNCTPRSLSFLPSQSVGVDVSYPHSVYASIPDNLKDFFQWNFRPSVLTCNSFSALCNTKNMAFHTLRNLSHRCIASWNKSTHEPESVLSVQLLPFHSRLLTGMNFTSPPSTSASPLSLNRTHLPTAIRTSPFAFTLTLPIRFARIPLPKSLERM